MLPGRRTDDGAIFITDVAPGSDATFEGGIAVSTLGVIYADPAAEYEVRAMADTAGTSTVLTNGSLIVGVYPVNSYV